jgi:hypothetical protein
MFDPYMKKCERVKEDQFEGLENLDVNRPGVITFYF